MSNHSDKYKLIYQFNNNSPLFARIAQNYINNSDYENAIEILEKGIKSFPDYVSAYYLYAVCLANVNRISEAREMVEKASRMLDYDETKLYYLNQIDEIGRRLGFIDNSTLDEQTHDSENGLTEDENISIEQDLENQESDLEMLAKKLESAKIELSTEQSDDFTSEIARSDDETESGTSLVSETLAKIYLNQGNYSEALNLYKNLKEIQPERSQFYDSQIVYIKKIIEAESK